MIPCNIIIQSELTPTLISQVPSEKSAISPPFVTTYLAFFATVLRDKVKPAKYWKQAAYNSRSRLFSLISLFSLYTYSSYPPFASISPLRQRSAPTRATAVSAQIPFARVASPSVAAVGFLHPLQKNSLREREREEAEQ